MQDAAITAFAAVSVYDGVQYRIEDDHAAVIGHTDDLPAEVTLPAEIDGKPVTEICSSAFYERVGLKSITLPDSITVIGENAFDGCSCVLRPDKHHDSEGCDAHQRTLVLLLLQIGTRCDSGGRNRDRFDSVRHMHPAD